MRPPKIRRSASIALLTACVTACSSAGARPPSRVASPSRLAPPAAPVAVKPPPPVAATLVPGQKPPVEPGSLPALSATWGTADALSFVAAAPDRRWVVACQARRDTNGDGVVRVDVTTDGEVHGDELTGYLIDAPGPGTPIDAFLGADPSGRYIAIVREGRAFLRDTTTRVDVELPADLRDDSSPFVHPRAVSFDPTGRRLAYFQKAGSGGGLVVRELATGAEEPVKAGDGLLWRADFDASGTALVVRVVPLDTNGNGRLDWPVREATKPWMRCSAPLPRFAVWERPGDEPVVRVANATGGVARDVPGFVVSMAAGTVVVREQDATLSLVDAGGKRVPVARKGCEAKLVHADAARRLMLLTCLDPKGRAEAVLVGQGPAKPLGLTLSVPPGDHWFEGAPRLLPLHPGSDAALLDLDRREVEMLRAGDRILATAGTHALVLRGRSLVLHELGGGEREVGREILPLAHIARTGPVLFVPPYAVDVARGELLGRSDERAFAVATDGAILVGAGAPDAAHFARGPLRWKAVGAARAENGPVAGARAP